MIHRWFPNPLISGFLALVWLALAEQITPGTLILALVLATILPMIIAVFIPAAPAVRRPILLIPYVALVLWDVIIASFQVAKIILFMPSANIRSAYITVPIALTSPQAIAILAGTITLTPGTLTAEIAPDQRALRVHALHVVDPAAVSRDIKSRYEARLKRIFQQ